MKITGKFFKNWQLFSRLLGLAPAGTGQSQNLDLT